MPVEFSTKAPEGGLYIVDLAFKDEGGNPVVPTAASWTLTDALGVVVNSRSAIAITPAASVTVVLQGGDLAMSDSYYDTARRLLIQWTYSSTIAGTSYTDLPCKAEFSFDIDDLVGVS